MNQSRMARKWMADKTDEEIPMSFNEPPPIDLAALKIRCMNDEKFTLEMLRMFQTQLPPMVQELDHAMKSTDMPRAGKLAHALKGTAANISAQGVLSAAIALEEACATGTIQSAESIFKDLTVQSDRCLAFIATTLATAEHSI
jgi:HPt (histidine-containing phosphotransfer) domain-containing protein